MGLFSKLYGTVNSYLYVGLNKMKIDAVHVSTARTFTLPDSNIDMYTGNTNDVLTKTAGGVAFGPISVALSNLTDVSLSSPIVGQVLEYNGSSWINASLTNTSISGGVVFYNDDTQIIGTGTNNVHEVVTLNKFPITTTEIVDAWNCTSNTVFGEAYLYNTAVGGSQIDAGEWQFNNYCSVSSTSAGRVSSLTNGIYQVIPAAVTITTTGTGTSRTATAVSGTIFVAGDANASLTLASYLQTPQGLYQITAQTSPVVVTIEVPSTYVNESAVAFSKWKFLFSANTGAITTLNTSYALVSTLIVQSTFALNAGDKLGEILFATSNNTTTVNFTHNGTTHYSHFKTPLILRHNDLAGLQGGSSTERYHLTSAQATVATQAATSSLNGYLASTDWTKFNNKITAWATSTAYSVGDSVYFTDNVIYECLSAHTSGTFLTDYNTAKWVKLSNDEVNYLNSANLTTFTTYADAAGTIPVDGTGGSSNITWTADTSSPLSLAEKSYLLTKGAQNRQGDGVSIDFTIPAGNQGKIVTISFDYKVGSGTYADNDLVGPYIYDITNASLIEPSNIYIKNATTNASQKATFQTAINSTSYRLMFHVSSVSALAYTMKFGNIKVAVQDIVSGAYVGDWTSYTPTGSWVTNTTYLGKYRRIGDSMEIEVTVSTSGAPTSTTLTIKIPTGYTIDSSKFPTDNSITPVGCGTITDASVGNYAALTILGSSDDTVIRVTHISSTTTANVTQAVPMTWTSGDSLQVRAMVPILGWGSSITMGGVDAGDGRLVSLFAAKLVAESVTANTTNIAYTAQRDTHNSWNGTQFTCPVAGYYHVHGVSACTTADVLLKLYLNGSENRRLVELYNSSVITPFSTTIYCIAGDILSLRAGTSATMNGGALPATLYLNIDRLSSASAISSGETVACKYNTAAGQSIAATATQINYGVKIYDTHGAVTNPTTAWAFYAPIAGTYLVSTLLTFSSNAMTAGDTFQVRIFKNGVADEYLIRQVVNSSFTFNLGGQGGTSSIHLLAGDYIYIAGYNSRTGTLQATDILNHVEITRTGN